MLRKYLSVTLILLIINAAFAWSADGKNRQQEENKIKSKISKLGIQASIKLELSDGRKFNGRIGEINDDSFIILLGIKGDRMTISYAEVKHVKDFFSPGKGTKVGMGAATVVIFIGLAGMIVTVVKAIIK